MKLNCYYSGVSIIISKCTINQPNRGSISNNKINSKYMNKFNFGVGIPTKGITDSSFVPIKYNNNYKINNKGTIINKNNIVCKPFINNSGYYCIGLWKNNIKTTYCVHKLVAEHFMNNYDDSLDIDHIDNNKLNNNINNLQLITHRENCKKRLTPNIYNITFEGNIIKEYKSIREAANDLHIGYNSLRELLSDVNDESVIIKVYSKINKTYLYFKRY